MRKLVPSKLLLYESALNWSFTQLDEDIISSCLDPLAEPFDTMATDEPVIPPKLAGLCWSFIGSGFLSLMVLLCLVVNVKTAKKTARGATVYISPGDDLGVAIASLLPGDTLVLRSGVYTTSMYVSVAGTESASIKIRAEQDGQAIVDGETQRIPFRASNDARHIVVEGIRFQNSSESAVLINGSNITMRRVSAYDSGSGNSHIFAISGASDILLEDCASSGRGRNNYLMYESDNITLRRCWARWTEKAANAPPHANVNFQVYASNNCLIENSVGTVDPNRSVPDVNSLHFWIASWNVDHGRNSCSSNSIVGSVFYGFDWHNITANQYHGAVQSNNSIKNTVLIGNGYTDVFIRSGHGTSLERLTIVDQGNRWAAVLADNESRVSPTVSIESCSFVSGSTGIRVDSGASVAHSYNNFHNVKEPFVGTSQGEGETFLDPEYDTEKYGQGAFLIAPPGLGGEGEPNIGAEVLFQSQDGILTTRRLWPWPMEARICAETANILGDGISVTYESHQVQYDYDGDGQPETYNCTGGIWKTLEGVYPETHLYLPLLIRSFPLT